MTTELTPATHLRRLGVLVYDALIVFALMLFSSAITLPLIRFGVIGEGSWVSTVIMLAIVYGFFAWTWTRKGQTLGMRTWRVKMISLDGGPVSLKQASMRFATALPAWLLFFYGLLAQYEASKHVLKWDLSHPGVLTLLGLIWILLDSRPNSWRERLSQTRVIRLA